MSLSGTMLGSAQFRITSWQVGFPDKCPCPVPAGIHFSDNRRLTSTMAEFRQSRSLFSEPTSIEKKERKYGNNEEQGLNWKLRMLISGTKTGNYEISWTASPI